MQRNVILTAVAIRYNDCNTDTFEALWLQIIPNLCHADQDWQLGQKGNALSCKSCCARQSRCTCAGKLLSARHAAERLQICWHGGNMSISDLKDSIKVFLGSMTHGTLMIAD